MTQDISYRLAKPEDQHLVLEFLREHYYPEEALTLSSKPVEPDINDEEDIMLYIKHAYETCLVAMSGDEIVGAIVAAPKDLEEEKQLLEEATLFAGTKWGKTLNFSAALERDSKIYEKYNVNSAVHGHALAVHKKFRGRGIGLMLYKLSMDRAKELGFPLYSTDCTSVYSVRLCEFLGMDCVNVCLLEDFRLPGSDEQVFFPPEGQNLVKTFAKRL